MGNCASASNIQVELGVIRRIRVVHAAELRVVDVELPTSQAAMSVGELMLEFPPGHFVAQFDNFSADFHPGTAATYIGKRASPLGADAEATPGLVYVLFPMPRLHTRITPEELLSLAKLLHLHDPQLPCKVAHRPPKPTRVLHRLFTGGARVEPLLDHEDNCTDDNLFCDAVSDNDQVASGSTPITSALQLHQQNGQDSIISSSTSFMHVIKSKPWAPKLETIKEGSS